MMNVGEMRDIHLWAIGELRTDGWKSQWRLDFEQYMKDKPPAPKIKLVVKAKPRTRYVAKYDYSGKFLDAHVDRQSQTIKFSAKNA